jgi:transposase-like protein
VAHANARLTVRGRALLVERILAGHRPADVAHQMGCSRATAYKWLRRFRSEGASGLADRPSRPRRCPHRTPWTTERRILEARRIHRRGADWIGDELGLAASTVGRVIARHRMPLLRDLDALTGAPVRRGPVTRRRYERARPGELIHVDVKKLGRIPDGGGWRAHGRGPKPVVRRAQGFDYVHSAVDDHSRLAYSEIHADERGVTCAGFLARAATFFAGHGITRIEEVMSDNAFSYRLSDDFPGPAGGSRGPPPPDPAPLPLAERESGAVQPDPARRVGVLTGLHQQRRARRVPGILPRALQHPAPPQQPQRPPADQPPVNNVVSDYS